MLLQTTVIAKYYVLTGTMRTHLHTSDWATSFLKNRNQGESSRLYLHYTVYCISIMTNKSITATLRLWPAGARMAGKEGLSTNPKP